MMLKCKLDGDPADIKTNPVMPEHLRNLFSDFRKLEEIGLHYEFLTSDNVFYGKNGAVEIDSLRRAKTFSIDKKPGFILSSNADGYEAGSLCSYVDSIENKYQQFGFLKCYLQQKSKYHAERANLLIKRGFSPDSKAVIAEDAAREVLRNPSNEIVKCTRDKFEIYILKNEAAKEWHDGNIFVDGKAKPKKRFASNLLKFEALKRAIMLEEKMNTISKESQDKNEREYFALEAERIGILKQEICDDIEESGSVNFADKSYGKQGLYLGTKADKEFYDKTFKTIKSDIKAGKSAETINKSIDILEDFYRTRAIEWKIEKNKAYKQTYEDSDPAQKADIIPIESRTGKQSALTRADVYSKQAQFRFN